MLQRLNFDLFEYFRLQVFWEALCPIYWCPTPVESKTTPHIVLQLLNKSCSFKTIKFHQDNNWLHYLKCFWYLRTVFMKTNSGILQRALLCQYRFKYLGSLNFGAVFILNFAFSRKAKNLNYFLDAVQAGSLCTFTLQ